MSRMFELNFLLRFLFTLLVEIEFDDSILRTCLFEHLRNGRIIGKTSAFLLSCEVDLGVAQLIDLHQIVDYIF